MMMILTQLLDTVNSVTLSSIHNLDVETQKWMIRKKKRGKMFFSKKNTRYKSILNKAIIQMKRKVQSVQMGT